jgi:hypothetical protein
MRRLILVFLLTSLTCAAQEQAPLPAKPDPKDRPIEATNAQKPLLVIPAGTKVVLALTRPVWSNMAKPGDSIYAKTTFPVATGSAVAIPPGTYAEGRIIALTKPKWTSAHAEFLIQFTKLIFINGYVIEFPAPLRDAGAQVQQVSVTTTSRPDAPDDVIPAVAPVYVEVSSSSDILLDNAAQIEMVLQVPLALDADSVAAAARKSKRQPILPVKSATLCRPTPATPGTPDTVIPGTPATPGTPDTVIPGGPGMPDIVIPGTPGTPGTSDTVISGSPGSPEIPCPRPPFVTSGPKVQPTYTKSFRVESGVHLDGKQLAPGTYELKWKGGSPSAQVDIRQNGSVIASVPARVVTLSRKAPADASATRTNADGSLSVESVRFVGETFALYFDVGGS